MADELAYRMHEEYGLWSINSRSNTQPVACVEGTWVEAKRRVIALEQERDEELVLYFLPEVEVLSLPPLDDKWPIGTSFSLIENHQDRDDLPIGMIFKRAVPAVVNGKYQYVVIDQPTVGEPCWRFEGINDVTGLNIYVTYNHSMAQWV